MISCKEVAIGVEEGDTSLSVPRDGNNPELRTKHNGVHALDNPFRARFRISISTVNDSCRAELCCIAPGIGHIVLVRQEDVLYSAHPLEGGNQMAHIARRIDQPIAVGMLNEIAVGAERFFGIEAVVVNVCV